MIDSNDAGARLLTRRRLLAGVATVAAGATAVVASDGRTLAVADADSDGSDPYIEVPVADGDEVVLAYTHSVEKTPVRDVYVVDGDALRMVRTEFSSFGAGLPTDGVYRTEEGYAVDNDERHAELTVAPSEVAGHELVADGERHDLTVATGSVSITVEAGSFLDGGALGVGTAPNAREGGGGP